MRVMPPLTIDETDGQRRVAIQSMVSGAAIVAFLIAALVLHEAAGPNACPPTLAAGLAFASAVAALMACLATVALGGSLCTML